MIIKDEYKIESKKRCFKKLKTQSSFANFGRLKMKQTTYDNTIHKIKVSKISKRKIILR